MGDSRSRSKSIVLWAAGVAVGALLIAAVIGWFTGAYRTPTAYGLASVKIDEHRSFPLTGVRSLKVEGVSEEVRIIDSPDDNFGVHFTGSVSASDEAAVPRLEAAIAGGTLAVAARHRPGAFLGFHSADLLLEVAVPRAYSGSLAVDSVSGELSLAPHAYETIGATTTSGAINLDAIETPSLSARSVSGAIDGSNLRADAVALQTTSGAIRVDSAASVMELRSVSGAITAETTTVPRRVDLGSTSGRISLRIPADSQFRLDARSTSGHVRCDFPITITGSAGGGRNALVGSVGGSSGGSVKIRTTSGAISVLR